MIAEGAAFTLPGVSVDPAGFQGQIKAEIDWGDGTVETVDVGTASAAGNIRMRFDYSLDSGFFTSARRAVLQEVADSLTQHFGDTLTAITPGGSNRWTPAIFHPSQGGGNNLLGNETIVSSRVQRVAQNEIIVFAGARDLPGNAKGSGATAYFTTASGTQAFLDSVVARGQPGALPNSRTDHAPWGGSIAFDNTSSSDWYFGSDPSLIGEDQLDFRSFAAHELMHVLGFGLEAPASSGIRTSWQNIVSGNAVIGSESVKAYPFSGRPPVQGGHWADSLEERGYPTLMADTLQRGQRQLLTQLDLAALDDLGWEINVPSILDVGATHTYGDQPSSSTEYPISVTLSGTESGVQTLQQSVTVTNVAPMITTLPETVTIRQGQVRSVRNSELVASDPGFGNRLSSPASTEDITFRIDWGEGGEPSTGDTVVVNAGGPGQPRVVRVSTARRFPEAGTFTATATLQDDDGGMVTGTFRTIVLPPTDLTIDLSGNQVTEGGTDEVMVTVTRDTQAALGAINLTVGGGGQFDVPNGLQIPAGQTSVQFAVKAIDDNTAERNQAFDLSISGEGYNRSVRSIEIVDNETPLFQNASNRFDVDGQNGMTVLDALVIINALSGQNGLVELDPQTSQPDGVFPDVSGDYQITPIDALQVINALAVAQNSDTSGEAVGGFLVARNDRQSAVDQLFADETVLF